MIEAIQNLDWVLRVTLTLWVVWLLLRAGGAVILQLLVVGVIAIFPFLGVVVAFLTGIAGLIYMLVTWIFTIWSAFILLGYLL